MLGRILKLDLSISWGRVAPVVLLSVVAAVLPVGVPLLLGHAIDGALQGKGVLELLPTLGLIAVLAVAGGAAELLTNALGARVGYGLSWELARKLRASQKVDIDSAKSRTAVSLKSGQFDEVGPRQPGYHQG